jgi:outer membrane murein-binding lipoprotein Lpp
LNRFFSAVSSCNFVKTEDTSTTDITSTSEQELQTQINDLSNKLSAFNNIISQLRSQMKAIQTPTTTPADEEVLSDIDITTASIDKLNTTVISLQNQVTALQASLKAAETTIGTSSVTVNGLSIIFITNSIDIGMTGSTTPGVAQFAIKIINTTSSAISNVDVTGTITSSESLSGTMASAYPQLTDGAGLCSYAYSTGSINGPYTLNFEAYSSSKTSLSIPAGGSITFRPKMSIMAITNYKLPATTFKLALNTITYDTVATK